MTELLSLQNVSLNLGGKEILRDITLSVNRKDILTVIGPNGAGKTSLLGLIIGRNKPASGIIKKAEGLKIGYVPQKVTVDSLMPMTVADFLNNSRSAMDYFDIGKIEKKFLYTLSGGELQKVLLARALLRSPDLLLLDEASQGLDIAGIIEFYGLIDRINRETGAGIIMVSHDLNIVLGRTGEVICLNGHICCKGPPEQISSDKEFAALFGKGVFDPLAFYRHHHDHSHNGGEKCI